MWAYCLPSHVRLILNPRQADGLGRAVGEASRRYSNFSLDRGEEALIRSPVAICDSLRAWLPQHRR